MDSDALFWSILICGVLAILSNKHTAFLFLPSDTNLAGWIPPPICLFFGFFIIPIRSSLTHTPANDFIALYVYLAFGFGFSLSNIRQPRKSMKIFGVIFLVIFTLLIILNLFVLIDLWRDLIRVAHKMGY